jgi:uncharacterized protein (DUF2237 family)
MSSKDGRVYAVLNKAAFTEAQYNLEKPNLISSDYPSVRCGDNDTKCILKWRGATPALLAPHIIFSGTCAELADYLVTNAAAWNVVS